MFPRPDFRYNSAAGLAELHYLPGDDSWKGPVHYVDPTCRFVIYYALFQCMSAA